MKWNEMKSLSRVQLFATPCTVAYQAPPSMEFSRQEYWSGVPLPNVKLKTLYSVGRETFWSCPPVNGCRKEEINTFPPWCWSGQEIFCKIYGLYTIFPHLFQLCSIKETGVQTLIRWYSRTLTSWDTQISNKVDIPCLNTSSPDYWPVLRQADQASIW